MKDSKKQACSQLPRVLGLGVCSELGTNAPVATPSYWIAAALPYSVALGGRCAQGSHHPLQRAVGEGGESSGRKTQAEGHGSVASSPAGLRRVMLRAHRQAWCWQDEWTELSMADIRALEEETARMLAQRMAKCNSGSEGAEAQAPGKPSVEARAAASHAGTPDGPEAPSGPDASPDASFGKQWSSSSRSSYSSQHGGEAGARGREGAALGLDSRLRLSGPAGGVSPQSLSEWRMQNIARDSENSSEEEFFDAHGQHRGPAGGGGVPERLLLPHDTVPCPCRRLLGQ